MAQADNCLDCKWWKQFTDLEHLPLDKRPEFLLTATRPGRRLTSACRGGP
jgi:hypothetical protein